MGQSHRYFYSTCTSIIFESISIMRLLSCSALSALTRYICGHQRTRAHSSILEIFWVDKAACCISLLPTKMAFVATIKQSALLEGSVTTDICWQFSVSGQPTFRCMKLKDRLCMRSYTCIYPHQELCKKGCHLEQFSNNSHF